MNSLFEKLGTLMSRRKDGDGSPFDSVVAVQKWLAALPVEFDYETHHALVEGLERFNAGNIEGNPERLKMLMAIEEASLPLQLRIVEHYMRVSSQAALHLASRALWRESLAFWSLLAASWANMLKHAYKGPARNELKPMRAEIATRTLRYAGLAMRWECHHAKHPSPVVWHRVHKIYQLVERHGYAEDTVTLNARPTSCAREFSLAVLLGLMNPNGYTIQEIETIAQLFESFPNLPLPQSRFVSGHHTHAIDLSVHDGAFALDDKQPAGEQLRYFALAPLVEHLQTIDPQSGADEEAGLPRQIADLMSCGALRRGRQRLPRFGRVWVASGIGNILASLLGSEAGRPHHGLEHWTLRDESNEGMGFSLEESTVIPHGRLVAVSSNPSASDWQLLAIRWNQNAGNQLLVGAQRLSRHPRRVEISFAPEADAARTPTHAVLLPIGDAELGESNLLMPQTHYRAGAQMILRDGDDIYRLRLGEVHESHERWVRVGVDVLSQEQFAAAA